MALYNATDGDNWTNNDNWLTDNDISTWYGVDVSDGSVTALNLDENNLTGELPVELGNLTNLTRLNLWGNPLSGSIPTELGNLTNLTYLGLQKTELSGSVPVELSNLTNLTQLWLGENKLSGSLPQSLTELTKLEKFHFGTEKGLCAPSDAAFQTWLQGIEDHHGPTCAPPAPPGQREALVALYNATDGDNWTNNTYWLSDNDISTWHGVEVSGDFGDSIEPEEEQSGRKDPSRIGQPVQP